MSNPTDISHGSAVSSNGPSTTKRVIVISFLHLDLGIGGAEQLVLQLAHASRALHDTTTTIAVELWTTRCDAHHCFASVRPPDGVLYPSLRVYGRWIPAEIAGRARALCSTLRLWYLTWCWILFRSNWFPWSSKEENNVEHIIVLDVLPTPLPLLQLMTNAHLLFYCHFPDQLLTRNKTTASLLRNGYRQALNALENRTMAYSDMVVVNSKFTRTVVQETFSSLQAMGTLPVLYPALDTTSLDAGQASDNNQENQYTSTTIKPIVSLNRYERKKNLELLPQAAHWIRQKHPHVQLPPIIIAGGYDVHNIENVEYRGELAQVVKDYQLTDVVKFRQSISDAERKHLLRTALCVVYTPSNEHFGIVPLEAMYCETPVLAVNSGGPVESVVDGVTGYLRPPTAQDFGEALLSWIQHPSRAASMGAAGRAHVIQSFGFQPRLVEEWRALLQTTIERGRARQESTGYRVSRALVYIVEALLMLVVLLTVTHGLRKAQILNEHASLLGGVRRAVQREEL